jgi:hypothetical protein
MKVWTSTNEHTSHPKGLLKPKDERDSLTIKLAFESLENCLLKKSISTSLGILNPTRIISQHTNHPYK